MFPAGKSTHLISDEDMDKLFRHRGPPTCGCCRSRTTMPASSMKPRQG